MAAADVRIGDFVVMDGVCWEVTGVMGRAPVGDYSLARQAGADLDASLVPIQMLARLIALGEVVLARDVNAS